MNAHIHSIVFYRIVEIVGIEQGVDIVKKELGILVLQPY